MTVNKIHTELEVDYSYSTVRRAMIQMGYSCKREGHDLYVSEKPDVVQQRHRFALLKITKQCSSLTVLIKYHGVN